jgi:hypothetical protein
VHPPNVASRLVSKQKGKNKHHKKDNQGQQRLQVLKKADWPSKATGQGNVPSFGVVLLEQHVLRMIEDDFFAARESSVGEVATELP